MKKQIVRSGLILAWGLLTTVAYMTAADQPANSSSGSAVQQPAVAVFGFVPQSEAVTDTAALSSQACSEYNKAHPPAADAAAAPNNATVDPFKDQSVAADNSAHVSAVQAQNAANQASLDAQAAGELGTVDVAAVVTRLNQRVSEFSEKRAAAVARYPTMTFTFFVPTFFIWPQFP